MSEPEARGPGEDERFDPHCGGPVEAALDNETPLDEYLRTLR
jgi:hypothetical protein